MVETVEKEVCRECGVDVRENTTFCYNCGSRVAELPAATVPESNGSEPEVDAETRAALDDLAEKFKIDEEADNRLAKAAAERKKARLSQRRSNEYTWAPVEDRSSGLILLVALLITVITAVIVFLTVVWR
jgi:predicted amidophosphoribosyltransferase